MDLCKYLKNQEQKGTFLELVEECFPGNVNVENDLIMVFNNGDFAHESGSIFTTKGELKCPGRVVSDLETIPENKNTMAIQIAEDGPYIRVWWHNATDTWMISSQRKIVCHSSISDALCRIFETQDLQELFAQHLDRQYVYGFVVNSKQLSSVVQYAQEQVKLVSKIDKFSFTETLVWNNCGELFEHCCPELGVFPKFISYDSVHDALDQVVVDNQVVYRGLVFHDYSVGRIFKYDNPQFQKLHKLAQLQDLELEYLFASGQERWYMMQQNPDIDFVSIDKKVYSVIRNIIDLYYDSIVYKRIELPDNCPALPLLKRLHMMYQREGTSPYPHIVEDCLRKSTVRFIRELIKWNNHYNSTGKYVYY